MASGKIGLRAAIDAVLKRSPPRAAAFIVTLYGDVVVPRGGDVWIGNVIEICGRAGLNESLVRTSVSRLVGNGTLAGERQGRRSFYRLTPSASHEFENASLRIYSPNRDDGANDWTFIRIPREDTRHNTADRLQRAGFAFVAPDLAIAPGHRRAETPPGNPRHALVFHAELKEHGDRQALQDFAVACWPLDELDAAYRRFIAVASPLGTALPQAESDGADCLVARLLLVHEFRRVVLADPGLPARALPDSWSGHEAWRRFASLYNAFSPFADRWIAANLVDVDGPIRPVGDMLARRATSLSAMLQPA